jgi:hypothetical protein
MERAQKVFGFEFKATAAAQPHRYAEKIAQVLNELKFLKRYLI